jgi:hypothetical protein
VGPWAQNGPKGILVHMYLCWSYTCVNMLHVIRVGVVLATYEITHVV